MLSPTLPPPKPSTLEFPFHLTDCCLGKIQTESSFLIKCHLMVCQYLAISNLKSTKRILLSLMPESNNFIGHKLKAWCLCEFWAWWWLVVYFFQRGGTVFHFFFKGNDDSKISCIENRDESFNKHNGPTHKDV